MTDRLAEALQNTRIHQESASHALSVGDVEHWCLKAAVDVDLPRLLALAGAAQELAGKLASEAARFSELAENIDSDGIETSALSAWQAYGRCAAMLSRAISRALFGDEAGDDAT